MLSQTTCWGPLAYKFYCPVCDPSIRTQRKRGVPAGTDGRLLQQAPSVPSQRFLRIELRRVFAVDCRGFQCRHVDHSDAPACERHDSLLAPACKLLAHALACE